MKINIFFRLLVLICCTGSLFSCSKNDGTDTPPEENKEPYRIEKRIFRHKSGSDIIVDTFAYQYDDSGRVTRKYYPNDFYEDYQYTNGKISSIKSVSASGTSNVLNFAQYSDNGDTILLDFTRPDASGEGMDTVQLTYIFDNGYQTDYWTYLHNYSGGFLHFQKEGFSYNSQGNLAATYFETLVNPRVKQFEVLAWDDKINPRHDQPKLNSLALDTGLPLQSSSLHNPTKYKDGLDNIYEVEMTYNADGYPLTAKMKSDDFVMTELIYNR